VARALRSIYFSRFHPTWDLGGGSRRMMQVWETLQALGGELRSSARAQGLDAGCRRRLEKGGSRLQLWRLRSWAAGRRKAVFRLREISRAWSRAAGELAGMDLVFMDDPIYFLPLFESLQRLHVPVVAICHNLETLVPSQVENGSSLTLLRRELDILSRCRLVVTISREETWLLRNLGVRCFYFPYYPREPVLGRLQAVRGIRAANGGKSGILMLANAKNPQSGQGMERFLAHWREKQLASVFGPLLVAGFHSDKVFPARLFGADAQLLGQLENDRLDELLARVAACLCYQESGGGALTRICEMLVAGVPVLANAHAARSYHGREGLIEFADLDGLEDALRGLQRRTGAIPPLPPPDPAPLLAAIARVLEGGPA